MEFLRRIFGKKKKGSPLKLPSSSSIVDAFTEYINNEIPSHFIDTSKLRFIARGDIFHIFEDEIANVTEQQIQERLRSLRDPLSTYQPRRDTVLRQIIQETVKYVVLSHCSDEVVHEPTYQDVSSWKWRTKRFKKLAKFCKTSRKLGYRLAWVDTCCIDKSNAAELDEAIHAVYKWHANSCLCIVHLAESASCEDWAQESWFTRVWALQELIAPRRLKFYNKHWQPFTPPDIEDDRRCDEIIPSLERVTRIAKTVFTADNSHGVQGYCFWEIMSWASERQTTRIEDRAYSLIGLLHANLPIAYGEGHRAFSRLVESIVARNPSWDIFAWSGQPSLDHFALPSSPAAYPAFDALMVEGRAGAQDITITPNGLSLKSLPLIPMEISSVVESQDSKEAFRVNLKPRRNEEGVLGKYGDLVVECGGTRLRTIRDSQEVSACILNHHCGGQSSKQGRLVVGSDYICFLLHSKDKVGNETSWLKLNTNNILRISCVGSPNPAAQEPDLIDTSEPETFCLSLVTTFIQSASPS